MTRVYLGIDTATSFLSLALWSPEGGTLASFQKQIGRAHTERVIPELQNLLARAGVKPQDIAGVGVGTGPGSYTGLRVGHATAQGLARGWGVGLGGGSTLAAIAAGSLTAGETGVAAIDARRGNVYAAVYRCEKDGLVTLLEPAKIARDEVKNSYKDAHWLEGTPPDASFLARAARDEKPPVLLYL